MPVLSYMDNIFKLSYCFVNRDYSSICNEIRSMKETLNYRYEEGGDVDHCEDDLRPGIQPVDGGVPREILAEGNVFQHGPPSFLSRSSSRSSSSAV